MWMIFFKFYWKLTKIEHSKVQEPKWYFNQNFNAIIQTIKKLISN